MIDSTEVGLVSVEPSVRVLLDPQSVAVIGASAQPTRISGIIISVLRRFGFTGSVYPVNPKYEEIGGFKCFASIEVVPSEEPIDVAVLFVSRDAAVEQAKICARRGVRALVVVTAGFAELDDEGARLQGELAEVAAANGMAVAGPNCAGLANFGANFVAYGTTNFIDLIDILAGNVAILTASGGLGNTLFTYCQERHVGLSHLVGIGNEAVTTSAAFLEAFVDDPAVKIVVANLEAIREPVRFFNAADAAVAAGKPVIVLKGGRSEAGQQSIVTHTAALGGSPAAFAGAFRQHAIIQAFDLDELADLAMLLSRTPRFTGNRIGLFSLPGGGTGLVSDIAADHGFVVPDLEPSTVDRLRPILPEIASVKNPLDPTAGFGRDDAKLRAALTTFAGDPNVDVLVFFPLASEPDYALGLARSLIAVSKEISKPVVCIWTAGRHLETGAWRLLHENGICLFTSTESCFRALEKVRWYSEVVESLRSPLSQDFGRPSVVAATRLGDGTDGRELLTGVGIRFPKSQLAQSATEARTMVQAVGGSAALKIRASAITHKTEAGGVRLAVDADAAAQAYEEIIDSARGFDPSAVIDGVEVQEMVPSGVEMLLGVTTDEQLGPILTVGLGGVFTEVLHDIAMRPVPISRMDAEAMLSELQGVAVLGQFRGRPAVDREALIEAMLGLSTFADMMRDRHPEIELNPLVVGTDGQGALAVDLVMSMQ